MTPDSRTPRGVWKADEAEFFLSHLRQPSPSSTAHRDPLQPFAFYLSAFLNAAYSSREILRLEALQDNAITRDMFDDWRSRWEVALVEDDARIWTLMRETRRQETHLRGVPTVPVSGLTVLRPQQLWRGGIYGSFVMGSPPALTGQLLDDETALALSSVVPLRLASIPHFEIEGDRLEVVASCSQYLALLRRYIADLGRVIESHSPEGERL
jgi:hypothetical protein